MDAELASLIEKAGAAFGAARAREVYAFKRKRELLRII
jgi:hypothetical protein